jgi:hypothetical protein
MGFHVICQAYNKTNPYPAVARSTHDFFLWLPGDDFIFFVRVEVNAGRTRHTYVSPSFPESLLSWHFSGTARRNGLGTHTAFPSPAASSNPHETQGIPKELHR